MGCVNCISNRCNTDSSVALSTFFRLFKIFNRNRIFDVCALIKTVTVSLCIFSFSLFLPFSVLSCLAFRYIYFFFFHPFIPSVLFRVSFFLLLLLLSVLNRIYILCMCCVSCVWFFDRFLVYKVQHNIQTDESYFRTRFDFICLFFVVKWIWNTSD